MHWSIYLIVAVNAHFGGEETGDERQQECCHFSINPEAGQVFAQKQDGDHADEEQRDSEHDNRQDLSSGNLFRDKTGKHCTDDHDTD